MKGTILIVDDEQNIRKILSAMLRSEGYEVLEASNLDGAKALLRQGAVQVVLTDLRLEREDGSQLLRWVKEEQLAVPVVILTAHGTVDSAVDAMKQGAIDYLSKPFERRELVRVLEKALLSFRFQQQNAVKGLPESLFVGSSPKIKKVLVLVEKVAPADTTVLITGESGTGKELIAQTIHEHSPRKDEAFIKINCAAIPENLLESELFGHEKGAFTGADNAKPGRFELATGGTLFLDEIGEMTLEMQVKLLRVLQELKFERVGGIRTIQVNVRLIAATNRNLEEDVKTGRFRHDLYYRLNVLPIHLPPLREREEDIPALVAYFSRKMGLKLRKEEVSFSPETLELLRQFPWPGNIRQLENVVERCLLVVDGNVILPDHLPDEVLDYEEDQFEARQSGVGLKEIVKDATRKVEKRAIEEALEETANNVTQAARLLNISRKGLQLKMKELGFGRRA